MNHQLKQGFQSSAGEVAWDVVGDGPNVVLVHGTPANSIIWRGVIERLADRYRIHYLDLPGYGASEKFEGQEVRLRSFARVLAEFLDDRGLAATHLVGHDFGAAAVLGAHLVEQAPARSITIADGVVLSPWGTAYSRHVNRYEKVFAAVPEYIHRATLSAHLDTAVARAMSAEMKSALIEPWTGDIGQSAYYRQVAQFDYEYTDRLEALYPEVDVPFRILWGEEDGWVDVSEGNRLQQIVQGAELRLLPDAGHFSMVDCPGLFARELDDFLGSLETADTTGNAERATG